MRLPKTIRFDASDTHAFERAAAPGEWAVTGAFVFADVDPQALVGKARQAFVSGFLGTDSFGWSTFVAVSRINAEQYRAVIAALAERLMTQFGAPDRGAAEAAAREEVKFAASLCEHKLNTILCVTRALENEGIVERFRVIEQAAEPEHAKIWQIVDDDDDENGGA